MVVINKFTSNAVMFPFCACSDRLTLDAVFQYRDVLGSEWDCLPTSLSSVLRARLPTLSTSQESEEQKTRSCVVS